MGSSCLDRGGSTHVIDVLGGDTGRVSHIVVLRERRRTNRFYNTSESELSVAVTTVDHSPAATFEEAVPSGETEIRAGFVSVPAGTTVTL